MNATLFYKLLEATQQPLYEDCNNHSELSAAMRLLSIKSEHNMSNHCFDDVLHLMQTPTPNRIPNNFNTFKKKVKELGLDYKSIHCYRNGCMSYYKQDEQLTSCKFCGSDRFKGGRGRGKNNHVMHYMPLTPRLQRLYAFKKSPEHMVWHKYHATQPGVLSHPSDAEA